MARVTSEFIRKAFYKDFRKLSQGKREGILEALTVLHESFEETAGELTYTAEDPPTAEE